MSFSDFFKGKNRKNNNSLSCSNDDSIPTIDIRSDMFTRIVEIYANNISATEFDYEPEDGLALLLNQNLAFVLSEVIKILYINYEVYIPLFFGDPADPEEEYIPFGTPNLVKIGNPSEFISGWHPSRYVLIKLNDTYIKEIQVLKRACLNYEEALNNSKSFISMMRMIFIKLGGVKSIWELKPSEYKSLQEFQENMSSGQRTGVGILGEADNLQEFSPKMDGSSTAFHFIKDDVLAKSGLDAMTLWGASGNDNNHLTENEVKFRSLRATLIRPLINKILEKLNLKSNWNFKIDNVQKQKTESEAEKNQMAILEKYLEIISSASEKGLSSISYEIGEQLAQYLNTSNREGILEDINLLNKRNLKILENENQEGANNENK